MEVARDKKKGKSRAQENVPLHDIINPDRGRESPQPGSPQAKKKRAKKNDISPKITTSSLASIESTIKQDAWVAGENVTSEKSPANVKTGDKRGVANPALVINDETQLPGSVSDLKNPGLDNLPTSSPAANNTIIDNNDEITVAEHKDKPSEDVTPRPATPQGKSSPSATPKSAFHRALFGRNKNRTKVAAIDDKENDGRPSTAPGYHLPFPDEFNGSTPQLKRPATAAAHGMRKPKSGRIEVSESMPSLRENSFKVSTRSLKDPPEITRSAVAYVPYLHARNTLARVIEDMKSMKMSHLSIVTEIEEQYNGIEIESREQFNAYVIALQDEQRNKINLFKQTIEEHNAEIKDRNKYWNEQLQSLKKRNKLLLRQKRALFIARQEDVQRFEKEKEELEIRLSEQDPKLRQTGKRDESQVILNEIDALDDSQRIVEAVPTAAVAAVVVANEIDDRSEANKWKERYQKEREEHLEHGRRLEKEMQQVKALLASKGASSLQERGVYEEKIKELTKELAKLQLEYEMTSAFLQSLMASVDSDEQFYAAKKKIEDDRAIMREEQTRLQSEIAEWEDDWKKKNNGKLPDEDEKPDAAKELNTQLSEAEFMLSNLDKQEEALIMLKEGRTPKATGSIPEPVVTTIEVRDPKLVQELEADKLTIVNLEEKLKGAGADAIRISDLENKNADLRTQLLPYERQLDSMKGGQAVVTSVALGAAVIGRGEELDDAKREIEDLKQQLDDARLGVIPSVVDVENEDLQDLMRKLEDYQTQIDALDKEFQLEKGRASDLAEENKTLRSDIERLEGDLSRNEMEVENRVAAATALLTTNIISKEKEIQECNDKIEILENARLANLDMDARTEIEKAKKEMKAAKIDANTAKKDKENMEIQLAAKDQKLKNLEDKLKTQKSVEAVLQNDIGVARKEKQKVIKESEAKFAEKEKQRKAEEDEKIKIFENKIRLLEAAGAGGSAVKAGRKSGDPAADKKVQRLETQMAQMKQQMMDDRNRIKELDRELKETKSSAKGVVVDKDKRATDKKIKDLDKKLEIETKKFERELKRANDLTEELDQLKKEHSNLQKEFAALSVECEALRAAAATGAAMATKVTSLEAENKQLTAEVKTLTDNYNTERVLRKKYYNMVEDMKGKIRVYCRYRPMSKTEISNKNKPVVKAPDEYTIQVQARGNMKEFQFDQVFTSESTQEDVFEDTYNLVQSAVDGFNVCIFAYGQTGSGKTYTMIGDCKQTQPGIAPRAFQRIFHLIEENKGKLEFQVSCYMLELYNDNLLDLLAPKGAKDAKLDVKKDKKGMVYVQGAVIQKATSSQELYKIFDKGSESRHVASTKMNDESSRSHLVVAVLLESTNLTTGAVTRGKLSLVDLAGSERVGKTGATAQQLKEANSINKSLSALGDVISALSSDQSFIPYRNNKLTMLMQDSLGGNAKTLMFVNISPADYNADETAISLTYASRVKLITNDATKNAESKEVARLRTMVAKLKSGEAVDDDE